MFRMKARNLKTHTIFNGPPRYVVRYMSRNIKEFCKIYKIQNEGDKFEDPKY